MLELVAVVDGVDVAVEVDVAVVLGVVVEVDEDELIVVSVLVEVDVLVLLQAAKPTTKVAAARSEVKRMWILRP